MAAKKAATVFLATMETRHAGTFTALAPTRREALDALRKGVAKYEKAVGRDMGESRLMTYTGKGDEGGDINVFEMEPFAAYCDYGKL